jgi:hypothetical protein
MCSFDRLAWLLDTNVIASLTAPSGDPKRQGLDGGPGR